LPSAEATRIGSSTFDGHNHSAKVAPSAGRAPVTAQAQAIKLKGQVIVQKNPNKGAKLNKAVEIEDTVTNRSTAVTGITAVLNMQ
jgi:hypothetical protein